MMDTYNIYYTTANGGSGILRRIPLEAVGDNVLGLLSLNDEITGIISTDKDD